MAQLAVALKNARLAQVEAQVGASPVLQLRTGVPPASCEAAATGTLLAAVTLSADWLTAPAGGEAELTATAEALASASGTAGHYRLIGTGGACFLQGAVSGPSGGGELVIDDPAIVSGQVVRVNALDFAEA